MFISYLVHFTLSANAFCDAMVNGMFQWPETEGGSNSSLPCPEGAQEGLRAYRFCNTNGVWDDPQIEDCVPFCVPETTGVYNWPGTMSGSGATLPCPFGPEGSMAVRQCGEEGQWNDPQLDQCKERKLIGLLNQLIEPKSTIKD